MKQQTTVPSKTDKYYLKSGFGGYNPCILGNVQHRYCAGSVLVNCVGWATGRFAAIIGAGKVQYLGNTNAKNFIRLAKSQGLSTGMTPRPGACMVWSSSGAGHVAIVEDVLNSNTVKTSESGWGYVNNYVTFPTRMKGSGNWGLSGYTFLGFVYNPKVNPYHTPAVTIQRGSAGESAKWLQWILVKEKCYTINTASQVDGVIGAKSVKALKKFQKKYKLEVDGRCGPATRAVCKSLYTLEGKY